MDKENRVAIVTGAANGIGRAIAFALARHGCTPVIADLDPRGGEAVVEELRV
ncbi:MAG: SDR family NAD(P)-dependent oxidoreductase, partial [Spirochaetota bacterium]